MRKIRRPWVRRTGGVTGLRVGGVVLRLKSGQRGVIGGYRRIGKRKWRRKGGRDTGNGFRKRGRERVGGVLGYRVH